MVIEGLYTLIETLFLYDPAFPTISASREADADSEVAQ